MTLLGYTRVSTGEQAREGLSLQAQHNRLEAYATLYGQGIEYLPPEGAVSGRMPPWRRPVLGSALRRLSDRSDGEPSGLIALRIDRISRSARDVLELVDRSEREGWALLTVDENLNTRSAIGRALVTILAAVAELERNLIAERTREGLSVHLTDEARASGVRLGAPPYGWRRDGLRLVEEPDEQEALAFMHRMRAGGMSLDGIAERLVAHGWRPRTGTAWNRRVVGKILAREE